MVSAKLPPAADTLYSALSKSNPSVDELNRLFPIFTSSITSDNRFACLPILTPIISAFSIGIDPQIAIRAVDVLLKDLEWATLKSMGIDDLVKRGIESSIPEIQTFCLGILERVEEGQEEPWMKMEILQSLGNDEIEVGRKAVQVFIQLSLQSPEYFFNVPELMLLQKQSNTVKSRLIDTFVALAPKIPSALDAMATLINLDSKDILDLTVQLQVLSKMTRNLDFTRPYMPRIAQLVQDRILGPYALDVFISLAESNIQEFAKTDQNFQISASIQKLIANKMEYAILSIGRLSCISTDSLKYISTTVYLVALADVLTLPSDLYHQVSLSSLQKAIESNITAIAGLTVLLRLSRWNTEYIASSASLMNLLLSREGKMEYEVRRSRYEVVLSMVQQGGLGIWQGRGERFVREGVIYAEVGSQIAVKSS